MQKSLGIFLALATLSAAHAQYSDPAGQQSPNLALQPAPIVQAYQNGGYARRAASPQIFDIQPSAGISVRSDTPNAVQTVAASSAVTEVRVTQGRADVMIHHPADHSQILVDLPAGQVSILKDGLYTFNAETNTVRVLHGEAEVGGNASEKGTKVKETQQLALGGTGKLKSVNAYPYELTADLLPNDDRGDNRGDGPIYSGYGDGFYGPSPYYAGFYPYGYGFYPYGYGYPIGVGFGFGYHGGYRGGFHGGGFRR